MARECRDPHPELHERCLQRARAYGGSRPLQEIRWIGARTARKLGHIHGLFKEAVRKPATDISGEAAPAARPMTTQDQNRWAAMRDLPASRPDRGEPMVSVVIPTYNRAGLVQRALASALAQNHRNLEVLVVDDASTDETQSVIAGYDDSRVRYLRQETNRGVAAARNRAMREARGDYIAFLDSDDEWLPEKLTHQVEAFSVHGDEVGLVYTGCETVDSFGKSRFDIPVHRGNLHSEMLLRNMLIGGGSGVMIRRSVVATVGGFDEGLPAIEDYDYWLRISRFYAFEYVSLPLTRYHDRVVDRRGMEDRRSRDFRANFEARHVFYLRNRHEMERAGIEHRFLLESGRRHLKWPFGDPSIGRRYISRAVKKRPFSTELYPWLMYAYLPGETNKYLVSGYRRLQAAAATLRGQQQAEGAD